MAWDIDHSAFVKPIKLLQDKLQFILQEFYEFFDSAVINLRVLALNHSSRNNLSALKT